MKIVIFILSVTFLFSCERSFDSSKTSKVTFELPSESLKSEVESSEFNSNLSPSSVNDFNCYGLFVTGPETELRRNICGRKNDSTFAKKTVGMIAGGVAVGSTLNINVPSGNDRVFTLVGFKTQNNYCPNFVSDKLDETKMSKPYFIGEVGGIKLNPGENKTLQIQMKYNSEAWFDDCQGPDFNLDADNGGGGSSPVPVEPTSISLRVPVNPDAIKHSACYPMVLELLNGGALAPSPAGRSVSLLNTSASPNQTNLIFYDNYDSCKIDNQSEQITQAVFQTLQSRKILYFRANVSSVASMSMKALTQVAGTSLESTPVTFGVKFVTPTHIDQLSVQSSMISFTGFYCAEVFIYGYNSTNGVAYYHPSMDLNLNFTFTTSTASAQSIYVTESCESQTAITQTILPMGRTFVRIGVWKRNLTEVVTGSLDITSFRSTDNSSFHSFSIPIQ